MAGIRWRGCFKVENAPLDNLKVVELLLDAVLSFLMLEERRGERGEGLPKVGA